MHSRITIATEILRGLIVADPQRALNDPTGCSLQALFLADSFLASVQAPPASAPTTIPGEASAAEWEEGAVHPSHLLAGFPDEDEAGEPPQPSSH